MRSFDSVSYIFFVVVVVTVFNLHLSFASSLLPVAVSDDDVDDTASHTAGNHTPERTERFGLLLASVFNETQSVFLLSVPLLIA